jgi:Ca2+:H+ antiporter
MNLALGSALASIGLTIPAVAAVSCGYAADARAGSERVVLLIVTLILSQSTLGTGRTTVLQG